MIRHAPSPYWRSSVPLPRYPRLSGDLQADVVVIGAGITGVTAAYLLARAGRDVVLIERRRCGGVDTGNTTAHLTCVIDTPLVKLAATFGDDHAQAVWDAGLAAIAFIEQTSEAEDIKCAFERVPGYLHVPRAIDDAGERAVESLVREAEKASGLGFDATFMGQVPFMERPGVQFDHQARFHPRRYLAGLLRAFTDAGGRVLEHSAVDEVAADPLIVRSRGHQIACADVVIATHDPIVGAAGVVFSSFLQTKLSLYTSYAVGGRVTRSVVPDALFWDTADPYHYVRLERHREFDYVIVGGEDHKTGQKRETRECFSQLEAFATTLVPGLSITHRWSGQVIEPTDGLPYIGRTAPHQFSATGFSGSGMTFGTLAAIMASDAIRGRANPWAELFDIHRTKVIAGVWNYLKENADYPYYLIRDRFAGVEGRSLRSVARGTGKILTLDGTRVAAYRDDQGKVTLKSPVCTHLGCLVQWNTAERTWDCPCHGSRFSPSGQVISGPAEAPLGDAGLRK